MFTWGIHSSQRGNHHAAFPNSSITAGTSTMRSNVESMSTATAMPNPISFTVGFALAKHDEELRDRDPAPVTRHRPPQPLHAVTVRRMPEGAVDRDAFLRGL